MENSKLKVALVSESPIGVMNGVSGSVRYVMDHLRDRGHDAMLICPKPAPSSYAGFPVVTTRTSTIRDFGYGSPGFRKVPKLIEAFQPDVVHTASPFWVLGTTAVSGAARIGVPSVAIYQTRIAQYAKQLGGTVFEQIAGTIIGSIHSHATLNLAPSTAAIQDLLGKGVPKETIRLWARGVDSVRYRPERRFSSEVQHLRKRIAPDGRPIIGYVGRLAPEKRVERLAAIRKVKAHIVIVGDGPSRPIVERALGHRAVFLGELKKERLADAYAAFDLFVHTGTEETFGQTLQEAMASGVPVVAPASGGPLDIVAHGETGLLYAPEDDDQLADHVRWMIGHPQAMAAMGRASRKRVEGRTWEALGDELIGHYRDAIRMQQLVQV